MKKLITALAATLTLSIFASTAFASDGSEYLQRWHDQSHSQQSSK